MSDRELLQLALGVVSGRLKTKQLEVDHLRLLGVLDPLGLSATKGEILGAAEKIVYDAIVGEKQ